LKDFKITATPLGSGNLETNDIKMNSFIMAEMGIPSQVRYDGEEPHGGYQERGVQEEALGDQNGVTL